MRNRISILSFHNMVSIILIITYLFLLVNLSLFSQNSKRDYLINKGISRYKSAFFREAIDILKSALNYELDNISKAKVYKYIALSWIALGENDISKKYFKRAIELNSDIIIEKREFSPEVIEIINDLINNFPYIYDFKVLPEKFSPYHGEIPHFKFSISIPEKVKISCSIKDKELFQDTEYFIDSFPQKYFWEWQDSFLNINQLDITLIPKNNEINYKFMRQIKLEVNLPSNLIYKSNKFSILGKKFLPEKNYHSRKKWEFGVLGIGLLIGCISLFSSLDDDEQEYESKFLLSWFMGYSGILSTIYGFGQEKTWSTPNEKNIIKNRKLRKEIEDKKNQIFIEQKIKKDN